MRRKSRFLVLVASLAFLVPFGVSRLRLVRGADEPGRQVQNPDGKTQAQGAPGLEDLDDGRRAQAAEPKREEGTRLAGRASTPGGGWGRAKSRHKCAAAQSSLKDTPNVADTCIAVLALIRSGSTPREGLYRDAIVKGVQLRPSSGRGVRLSIDRRHERAGTRVQQKLGPNIDTFLASMLLAEVKGRMPDDASEKAVDLACTRCSARSSGTRSRMGRSTVKGWAPILAQAMCGKGINRARQAGARCPTWPWPGRRHGAKLAFQASRPAPSCRRPEHGGGRSLRGRARQGWRPA